MSEHPAVPGKPGYPRSRSFAISPYGLVYGHRDSRVRAPFGHEWLLSQKVEDVSPEEMQRRWDAMA
ncbi:MAG TPA: hypothetical protein VGM54_15435 [Chthoniobacter sp.]